MKAYKTTSTSGILKTQKPRYVKPTGQLASPVLRATNSAVAAARLVIDNGGSEQDAARTAEAAARSVLLAGVGFSKNSDSVNSQSTDSNQSPRVSGKIISKFLTKRKAKKQANKLSNFASLVALAEAKSPTQEFSQKKVSFQGLDAKCPSNYSEDLSIDDERKDDVFGVEEREEIDSQREDSGDGEELGSIDESAASNSYDEESAMSKSFEEEESNHKSIENDRKHRAKSMSSSNRKPPAIATQYIANIYEDVLRGLDEVTGGPPKPKTVHVNNNRRSRNSDAHSSSGSVSAISMDTAIATKVGGRADDDSDIEKHVEAIVRAAVQTVSANMCGADALQLEVH